MTNSFKYIVEIIFHIFKMTKKKQKQRNNVLHIGETILIGVRNLSK